VVVILRRSDEMRPEWFKIPDNLLPDYAQSSASKEGPLLDDADAALPTIPFDRLWEGDKYWMPLLCQNQHFSGRTDFVLARGELDETRVVLKRWWFGV